MRDWIWLKKLTGRPWQSFTTLVMWSALGLLLNGCTTPDVSKPPAWPFDFKFMAPGSTNIVIVPENCAYGIWTTDRGLLYLQGLAPE